MEISKNFNAIIINQIYSFEVSFKSNLESLEKNIENLDELEAKVSKILEKIPDDAETLEVKRQLRAFKEDLFRKSNNFKKAKKGNTTIFDWSFFNIENQSEILNEIENIEIKKWIRDKVNSGQEIIWARARFDEIQDLLEQEGMYQREKKSFDLKKIEQLVFLNSPFNIKGKEIAYLYIKNFNADKNEELVMKCNVNDMISEQLLSVSEEIDLDILTNLKENNNLSKLYTLAYNESLNKYSSGSKNRVLNSLEDNINKIIIKNMKFEND